jgi:hypothetical protein
VNRAPVLGVRVVNRGERVGSKRRGIGVSMGNAMGVVAVHSGRRGVVAAPVALFRDAQRRLFVRGEHHRSRTLPARIAAASGAPSDVVRPRGVFPRKNFGCYAAKQRFVCDNQSRKTETD